jgi:hypothetical protein
MPNIQMEKSAARFFLAARNRGIKKAGPISGAGFSLLLHAGFIIAVFGLTPDMDST